MEQGRTRPPGSLRGKGAAGSGGQGGHGQAVKRGLLTRARDLEEQARIMLWPALLYCRHQMHCLVITKSRAHPNLGPDRSSAALLLKC